MILEKALSMISTDLFLKEYLELTQTRGDECGLSYDQMNYLNFLYLNRGYWQGFSMKKSIRHYGLNISHRFLKGEPYSMLSKTLNSVGKVNAKTFKQILDTSFQGHLYIVNRFKERSWY